VAVGAISASISAFLSEAVGAEMLGAVVVAVTAAAAAGFEKGVKGAVIGYRMREGAEREGVEIGVAMAAAGMEGGSMDCSGINRVGTGINRGSTGIDPQPFINPGSAKLAYSLFVDPSKANEPCGSSGSHPRLYCWYGCP